MINNYIFLVRLLNESLKQLQNWLIVDAFSQNKNEIALELIYPQQKESLFLVFNADPVFPFLFLKKNFSKKKNNIARFFESYFPVAISKISIADKERVFNILADKGNFYIVLKGKESNLLFIDYDNRFYSFKKIETENIEENINFIKSLNFLDDFKIDFDNLKNLTDENLYDNLRNIFPFFTRDLLESFENFKAKNSHLKSSQDLILSFFNSAFFNDIVLVVDPQTAKIKIRFEEISDNENDKPYVFKLANDAIIAYIKNKTQNEEFFRLKKNSLSSIKKSVEKITSKLNQIQVKLSSPSKENLYLKYANLILINAANITKGIDKFIANDIENGNLIEIPLNKNYNAGENANYYFQKAKDEKKERQNLASLYETLENKITKLNNYLRNIEKANNLIDLKQIMTNLNINLESQEKPKKEKKTEFNFRKFVFNDEYEIYVGKNDKNNDELTFQFSKPNDIWFHAKGCPGSHVIIRNTSKNQTMPKNVIEAAAQLAAYFSKAKNSKFAPVSYTEKKYVIKRKGMPPGQVALLKEKTIMVQPQIPDNCVQIKEEEEI